MGRYDRGRKVSELRDKHIVDAGRGSHQLSFRCANSPVHGLY